MTDQEIPVTEAEPEVFTQTVISPTWPRDEFGIMSALRRELARTAGRVAGDPVKLELYMDTLREGARWVQGRQEVQNRIKLERAADVDARIALEQSRLDTENADAKPQETDEERAARQAAAGVGGAVQSKV